MASFNTHVSEDRKHIKRSKGATIAPPTTDTRDVTRKQTWPWAPSINKPNLALLPLALRRQNITPRQYGAMGLT